MKPGAILLTIVAIGLWTGPGGAEEPVLPLHVLYVGKAKGERAADYMAFLKKHFKKVTLAERVGFDPAAAKQADVVVLAWSQTESNVSEAKSPFGKREDWSRPTILLGSAGLLLATRWELIGGAG